MLMRKYIGVSFLSSVVSCLTSSFEQFRRVILVVLVVLATVHLVGSGFTGLAQLVHLTLIKLELASFVFRKVGQVEGNSDEITLGHIVAFVCVIVNDHVFSVILSSCDILEVIQVERIGQYVIGVDALECLALGHGSRLQLLPLLVSHQRHIEHVAGIFFFFGRPFAIFVIQRLPVVVDVLVDLNVTDCQRSEVAFNLLAGPVSSEFQKQKHKERDQHGPQEPCPAAIVENGAHSVS